MLSSTAAWSPGFDHMVVQGITGSRPRVIPHITALYPRFADNAMVRAALQQALTGSEQHLLGMR